jgi:hypothetical protein
MTTKQRKMSKARFYARHGGLAAYTRKYREAQKPWTLAVRWARRIKREYGLTVEEFAWMWHGQDGKCAICHRPLRDGMGGLNIDHEHKKGGRVRGILCTFCNWKVLGPIERGGRERLKAAVEYLGWGRLVT